MALETVQYRPTDRADIVPDNIRRSPAQSSGVNTASLAGTISCMALPFSCDSLSPHLSREALADHHGKLFAGHVARVNDLVAGTEQESARLEDIIRQAAWKRRRPLLVNAAQVWNHGFFWQCLTPPQGQQPDPILGGAICKTFGSLETFRKTFVEKGVAHVGSGWLWLAWHKERGLIISATDNATPVWLASQRVPLLACDLWEHSYHLDWRHDRAGWLTTFIDELVNWAFVGERMASLLRSEPQWTYPAR